MTDRPFPPAWGRVRAADIRRPDDSGAWEMPDWCELTFPGEDGGYHHGSRGSTPPDTAALMLDGEVVALCDCGHLSLVNLYVWDSEYYQFLRLRAVLDPARWAETPWADIVPGQVFFAWDKFHWIDYDRTERDDPEFSYGGDWDDLEAQALAEHPHDLPQPPRDDHAPPSIHLLCQVIRSGDTARLQRMLDAGADPNGSTEPVPHPGVSISFSIGRTDSPLWVSVQEGTPQMTAMLLRAGAQVDARPSGGMTALHVAILRARAEHVRLLLDAGADPAATWRGKDAHQLAREHAPALAALLTSAAPRG